MHEKHLTKLRVKPKTSPNYCPVRTSLLSSLRGPWSFLSKTVDGSTVCRLAGPCRSLQVAAVDCKSLHGSTAPPCNLSLQTSLSSRLSLSLESGHSSPQSDDGPGGLTLQAGETGGNSRAETESQIWPVGLSEITFGICLKFVIYRDWSLCCLLVEIKLYILCLDLCKVYQDKWRLEENDLLAPGSLSRPPGFVQAGGSRGLVWRQPAVCVLSVVSSQFSSLSTAGLQTSADNTKVTTPHHTTGGHSTVYCLLTTGAVIL